MTMWTNTEGNVGNIHVPGRQVVFIVSVSIWWKQCQRRAGSSKATECFSRGRVKVVAAFIRAGFCLNRWQGRQASLHLPMLQCVAMLSTPPRVWKFSRSWSGGISWTCSFWAEKCSKSAALSKLKVGRACTHPKPGDLWDFQQGCRFGGCFYWSFFFFLICLVLFVGFFSVVVANAIPVFFAYWTGQTRPSPS